MNDTVTFTQGAFAVFNPDDTAVMSSFIPFRFNPEMLTRQLALEQAQGGAAGAAGAGAEHQRGGAGEDQGAEVAGEVHGKDS